MEVMVVGETYCHSIPEATEGNLDGRVERYFSML